MGRLRHEAVGLAQQKEALMPKRIRIITGKAGAKVPDSAVCVRFRTRFENPFWRADGNVSREEALIRFHEWLFKGYLPPDAEVLDTLRLGPQREIAWMMAPKLRGKDVACSCALHLPCHGDTWLKVAAELPADDEECADAIKSMLQRNLDFRTLGQSRRYIFTR